MSRPRWRPRQRTGVAVEGLAHTGWATAEHDSPGALNLRTLRQLGLRPRGMGLKDLSQWPAEPPQPARWNPQQFARAFAELCPTGMAHDVEQYAKIVLKVSKTHGTDPALLAALVYQQSECDAQRVNSWGAGLTMLNRGLLPRDLDRGRWEYSRYEEPNWTAQVMRLQPIELKRGALIDPFTNLYLAAALLKILEQQCPHIDEPFGSHPHRHYVSHFIWGDEVKDSGAEDRILETRRRLLEYYRGVRAPTYARVRDVLLVSPMDGTPRIATSGLGDDRDDGKRRHAGIDYLSRFGEPIRAVADGKVIYAGTDLASDRKVNVAPDKANLVPPTSMGARGLFVELDHSQGLRSVYAHLAVYMVQAGDHVQRGQLLGYVGRSGIRESDPHLHFGLFADGQVLDPLEAMGGLVFGPGTTLRGPPKPQGSQRHSRRRERKQRKQRHGALMQPLP